MNIFALWGEIEINRKKAETDIKAVEKQAEKSGKKMETSFDKVTKVVGAAIKEIDKYGDKIEKFGKDLSKKAGVPFAALTALMGGLAKATANYTATVKDNAAVVGLSTQSYQELQYAMQQSGLSQDEYIRMMGRVNQRIGFARQGNEKYRKSLQNLGISLEDVDKGLVGTEETFLAMINHLHEMDDAQKQAALAGDFFGVMLARKMMPLIRDGAQSVEELRKRAHELGLVMDDLAVAKGDLLADTLDDLSFTAKGLGRIFGSEMHAPMINVSRAIIDVLSNISTWLTENPKLVRQIVMWGGAIAGVLGVLVTLGTTLIVTGKIVGALGTIFNLLISKPMLIIAAIGFLWLSWENDWLSIRTTTEQVVNKILKLWDSLLEWWDRSKLRQWIVDTWEQVRDVWADEDLTLGQKVLDTVSIVANGIIDLIPGLRDIWNTWTDDDLGFGQKVLNTVSIVVSTVTDLIESINAWWTRQVVKLARKTAELLGLDPDEAWFVQLAEDLNTIWINEDLTFGEKIIESFKLIPGAQAITDFIDDVKDKIVNSKAWQWTVNVALPVIVDAGEAVIKAVVEVGGRMYDAIKKGLDTGDWSDFWSVTSDIWNAGVAIALSLQLASGAASWILTAIGSIFGNTAGKLGIGGIPLAIGLLTVGIQLKEAQAEGSYEAFVRNTLVAALVGAIGGAVFGPNGALIGFNLTLSLKLGEKIEEGIYSFAERLGLPRSHLQMVEEYKQYTQELYDEATKDMNWLQKRLWVFAGNKPEGLLDFPEWKEAMGYVTEEPGQREIDPHVLESVTQFAKELAEMYPQYGWPHIEDVALEKAFQILDSPTAFHEIMNVVDSFVSEVERIENAIDELSREMGIDLRSISVEEIPKLVTLFQNEYESIFEDIVKYHGVSPGRLIRQLISPELLINDEAVGKTIEETADDVERLTGELSKLEKQALIVAETLRQGGTLEQALALLGIAYWETRGYGGYTHIDPATGEVIRGGAGEYGIGQVMPGTGKDVWTRLWKQPAETWDESMLEDLDTNIAMMVSYFLDRYQAHGEDLRLAIEGYNRGTAIDGMQAYTAGVVEWMEGSEGQALADVLYDGMEKALEAMIQAGYDMGEDVRQMAAYLAQNIADYLVGQSPPPEGPLSVIDEGGANVGAAWVEGIAEGIEENESLLTRTLTRIKDLLSGIWEKVPEDIRLPIENAIKQAEEALFSLDDLYNQLQNAITGGDDPEEQAKSFMDRLKDALDAKLKALDDPIDRFASGLVDSLGALGSVIESFRLIKESNKALADANEKETKRLEALIKSSWVGVILTLISETESFAKAMELIGKVLAPVVTLFDAVLRPIIEGLLKLWNGIIDALASISIFGWKPFKGLTQHKVSWDDDAGGGSGGRDGGTGGRQISEITGPTRDLLVDLLSPLANFGQIVAPIQDIRDILDQRLPNFNAFGMEFAAAGAGAMSPAVVIENITVHSSAKDGRQLARDMMDEIEREMARRVIFGTRGRGGR